MLCWDCFHFGANNNCCCDILVSAFDKLLCVHFFENISRIRIAGPQLIFIVYLGRHLKDFLSAYPFSTLINHACVFWFLLALTDTWSFWRVWNSISPWLRLAFPSVNREVVQHFICLTAIWIASGDVTRSFLNKSFSWVICLCLIDLWELFTSTRYKSFLEYV